MIYWNNYILQVKNFLLACRILALNLMRGIIANWIKSLINFLIMQTYELHFCQFDFMRNL